MVTHDDWMPVIRSLVEQGVPAGQIGNALSIIQSGGSVHDAMEVVSFFEPAPAVHMVELLVAQAVATVKRERVAVGRRPEPMRTFVLDGNERGVGQ